MLDALNNETTFDHDDHGHLTEETIVVDGETLTRGYDHDGSGNLVRKVDRNGRVTVYDTDSRLIALRQTGQGGNEVADKYVTFAYSDGGGIETVTRYASLDTSEMVATSDYSYDDLGRLVGLDHYQNPDDPLAQYTWTYEGSGLVDVNSPSGDINPVPDHVWTFDSAFLGNLTQMISPDGFSDYSYDARGQLTGAEYDYQNGESYSYDANGNRTNPGYETGDHNRLLSDGTYDYEYDPEGNRTKRTDISTGAVTEYKWDHRNRLIEVTDRLSVDGPIVQTVEYVYDYQNSWLAKSLDPDGDGPLAAEDTHFIHDGLPSGPYSLDRSAATLDEIGQIVLQLDDTGAVTNRHLWGPAVDQILADEQLQQDGTSEILWPPNRPPQHRPRLGGL